MRNECLNLIGDEMVIYMKCDEYKILVDTKAHKFRIQMTGKEIDGVAYDIAADAISEAHEKCKQSERIV